MATTSFYNMLDKTNQILKKIDKKIHDDKSINNLLDKLINMLIDIQELYSKNEVSSFEYQYLKHHILFLVAKNSGSNQEVEIFKRGLFLLIEKNIIIEKEAKEIFEISPLSRWGNIF